MPNILNKCVRRIKIIKYLGLIYIMPQRIQICIMYMDVC